MPLIKHGAIIPDPWIAVSDGAILPEDAPAIVSFSRWRADRWALLARTAPLGVRLESDVAPEAIAEDVDRFGVIALAFPAFTDGRPYSHARLLRERHGYRGELRAVGNVLRDQFLFLHRCGFDAFEVADERAAAAWQDAVSEISVRYQPATADDRSRSWRGAALSSTVG